MADELQNTKLTEKELNDKIALVLNAAFSGIDTNRPVGQVAISDRGTILTAALSTYLFNVIYAKKEEGFVREHVDAVIENIANVLVTMTKEACEHLYATPTKNETNKNLN